MKPNLRSHAGQRQQRDLKKTARTVEAAVTGDRRTALKALLADPFFTDYQGAASFPLSQRIGLPVKKNGPMINVFIWYTFNRV